MVHSLAHARERERARGMVCRMRDEHDDTYRACVVRPTHLYRACRPATISSCKSLAAQVCCHTQAPSSNRGPAVASRGGLSHTWRRHGLVALGLGGLHVMAAPQSNLSEVSFVRVGQVMVRWRTMLPCDVFKVPKEKKRHLAAQHHSLKLGENLVETASRLPAGGGQVAARVNRFRDQNSS
jgi:hypothetical protein